MADLAKLEDRYRSARDRFAGSRSEKDHAAYRAAKVEFVAARVAAREVEEADPDHPRGRSIVTVTGGEG